MQAIHSRNVLYKQYLTNPTAANSKKYKKYRNTCILKTTIRVSRKLYYGDKLNKAGCNMEYNK